MTERIERCQVCDGSDLYDLLGHDLLGHRIANSLKREGIWAVDELRPLSDEYLGDLRNIGPDSVRMIRQALAQREA